MKHVIFSGLLATMLIITVSDSFSQEYIVKLKTEQKTIDCINLEIINGLVKFTDNDSGKENSVLLQDALSLNFNNTSFVSLKYNAYSFDTIKCSIMEITKDNIFYNLEEGSNHSINKDDVFYVSFSYPNENKHMDLFKKTFIDLHRNDYKDDFVLEMKDGKEIDVSRFTYLKDGLIYFSIITEESTINTNVNTKKIKNFQLKSPGKKKMRPGITNVLFSNDGNDIKVNTFNSFSEDKMDFTVKYNMNYMNFNETKDSLTSLSFYNYEDKDNWKELSYNLSGTSNSGLSNVHVEISSGIGYLIAKLPSDVDKSYQNYWDQQIRAGIVIDANINVFTNSNFGAGISFNMFSSSGTFEDIYEDNISVIFAGGSLIQKFDVSAKGRFFIAGSVGLSYARNMFVVLRDRYTIKGSSLGFTLSTGFDISVTDNFGLCFKGNYVHANILKHKASNLTYETKERENMSHIDALIGMKFYF